jgi:hypothetical protein
VRRQAGRRNGGVGQRGGSGRRPKSPVVSGISYPVSRHSSQEVCPWNSPKFVRLTRERDFDGRERERERSREGLREQREVLPGTTAPSLIALMRMTYEEWDQWTRGSAIRRAGYAGLRRNVAVALGNWASEEAVPPLLEALSDSEPLVRGHAAWALGEIPSSSASAALAERLAVEDDSWVRDELELALARFSEWSSSRGIPGAFLESPQGATGGTAVSTIPARGSKSVVGGRPGPRRERDGLKAPFAAAAAVWRPGRRPGIPKLHLEITAA